MGGPLRPVYRPESPRASAAAPNRSQQAPNRSQQFERRAGSGTVAFGLWNSRHCQLWFIHTMDWTLRAGVHSL